MTNITTNNINLIIKKWQVFFAIAVGTFVSVLDQSSVGLALPLIAKSFQVNIPTVQWVMVASVLATSTMLLPMGRLSDIIGRKKIIIIGILIFTLAAILCGFAQNIQILITARLFQGLGAAMFQANAMAILTQTFPDNERGKVIGLYMTVVGLGAVAGPVFGGGLAGILGWRFIFIGMVPFSIISLIMIQMMIPLDKTNLLQRPKFDWIGAAIWVATLSIFLLAIGNAQKIGWGSTIILSALLVSLFLFVIFILWEIRNSEPMINMSLFKNRTFSFSCCANVLVFLASAGTFFLMPFFLQGVLNLSPQQTGLIFVPTTLTFAITGTISGRISDKFGTRWPTIFGLTIIVLSALVLSTLNENSSYITVIIGMSMQAFGMGMFFTPNSSIILGAVNKKDYGITTALINMIRNTTHIVGIAITTSIISLIMLNNGFEPSLDIDLSSPNAELIKKSFSDGMRLVFMASIFISSIALLLSLLLNIGNSGIPKQKN